jgi:hypothetical protein
MYNSLIINFHYDTGDFLFDSITHLLKYSMLWQEDKMQSTPS